MKFASADLRRWEAEVEIQKLAARAGGCT